MQDFNLHKQ